MSVSVLPEKGLYIPKRVCFNNVSPIEKTSLAVNVYLKFEVLSVV